MESLLGPGLPYCITVAELGLTTYGMWMGMTNSLRMALPSMVAYIYRWVRKDVTCANLKNISCSLLYLS